MNDIVEEIDISKLNKGMVNDDEKEFIQALEDNDWEFIDCVEGCLMNNLLYSYINPKTGRQKVILLKETYLNCWSSAYTVYLAKSKKDRQKLYNYWDIVDKLSEEDKTDDDNIF